MARAIRPTPTLKGEEARKLLSSLSRSAPASEVRQRVDRARSRVEAMRAKVARKRQSE